MICDKCHVWEGDTQSPDLVTFLANTINSETYLQFLHLDQSRCIGIGPSHLWEDGKLISLDDDE